MREKTNKFKKNQKKRGSVCLKKDDMAWLSKNTHFDPEHIKDWHKVHIYIPHDPTPTTFLVSNEIYGKN